MGGLLLALVRPAQAGRTTRVARGVASLSLDGAELELDFNLVDAGMARPTVKDAEFVEYGQTLLLVRPNQAA